MPIMIRDARPEDAEGLGCVHRAAWLETYAGLLPADYLARRSAKKSAAMFARTGCRSMAAAVCDGQIVGFCGWFSDPEDPTRGEIGGLYLLAAYQKQGAGRALLSHALKALQASGHRSVSLWVLDTNRKAIGFYEAMGFRPSGETKQADLGAVVTELRYGKDL